MRTAEGDALFRIGRLTKFRSVLDFRTGQPRRFSNSHSVGSDYYPIIFIKGVKSRFEPLSANTQSRGRNGSVLENKSITSSPLAFEPAYLSFDNKDIKSSQFKVAKCP